MLRRVRMDRSRIMGGVEFWAGLSVWENGSKGLGKNNNDQELAGRHTTSPIAKNAMNGAPALFVAVESAYTTRATVDCCSCFYLGAWGSVMFLGSRISAISSSVSSFFARARLDDGFAGGYGFLHDFRGLGVADVGIERRGQGHGACA